MALLKRIRLGFRIASGLLAVTGWWLAAAITIYPPTGDALRNFDAILLGVFGVVAASLIITIEVITHAYENQREAQAEQRAIQHKQEIIDAVKAQERPYENDTQAAAATDTLPTPRDTATAVVAQNPFIGRITLDNLVEADEKARELGHKSVAAAAYDALPASDNLKQQTRDLVKTVRNLLKQYHGDLKIDSFVSPEIRMAFSELLLAVKNKLRNRTGELRTYDWPVTVTRMARFLDRLEEASQRIAEGDVPPVVL